MNTNSPFRTVPGDPVDQSATPVMPFPGGWIYGTIVAVAATHDQIFIRDAETRRREVLLLMPATQISIHEHPGSSRDLRLGQRVRVHCRRVHDELEVDNLAIEPRDFPTPVTSKIVPLHAKSP